ncbi:MAG TPA: glycoside hydrolase family 36 protein [Jatrophihabitans sp.]|jgi:alpha-galactosidase
MGFEHILTIETDPEQGTIYEEGWQSWSPSMTYRLTDRPWRAPSESSYRGDYGGTRPAPPDGSFSGEGLLAVEPGNGAPVTVIAADTAAESVPRIHARLTGTSLQITADGAVSVTEDNRDLVGALGEFGTRFATAAGGTAIQPAPTIWSSWYHYFTDVTQNDMFENIDAIAAADLPVDVVQLDDGYQTEIGDWLTLSDRFDSLADVVARIKDSGRRAGIWIAPFLAGSKSRVFAEHPEWIIGGPDEPAWANENWNQTTFGLDTTHPGFQAYLAEVFGHFTDLGFDFFKTDFIYGAALDGARHDDVSAVAAYRLGLDLIRAGIGESYLLGCGAPSLASVGKVDAMRVSPDTGPRFEPANNDMSKPSGRAAIATSIGRSWQHGRFWVNDPDCLIVRPEVENRQALAEYIRSVGGLRGSSDRIAALDDWGMATTRELLSSVPAPVPFS